MYDVMTRTPVTALLTDEALEVIDVLATSDVMTYL